MNPDQITPKENLQQLFVAETESNLVRITPKNLQKMKREHPEAAFELFNSVVNYIFFLNRKLSNQTENSVNKVRSLKKQLMRRKYEAKIQGRADSHLTSEVNHLFHHIRVSKDAPVAEVDYVQSSLKLSDKMFKDAKIIYDSHMTRIKPENRRGYIMKLLIELGYTTASRVENYISNNLVGVEITFDVFLDCIRICGYVPVTHEINNTLYRAYKEVADEKVGGLTKQVVSYLPYHLECHLS